MPPGISSFMNKKMVGFRVIELAAADKQIPWDFT